MNTKALEKIIYYGIIDGKDTLRLIEAYPDCFLLTSSNLK